MTEQFFDPDEHFKTRFRHIVFAQRTRRPLAILAILLALLGTGQNLAGVDILWHAVGDTAVTHPTTALCIVFLSIGLIHFRTYRQPPPWRVGLASGVLIFLVSTLILRLVFSVGVPTETIGALPLGAMGTDTALILACLFGSVLLRRISGRGALFLAMAASCLVTIAFIGLTYGQAVFEGQMAVTTLIALMPLTLSVLTIYVHRPVMRVVMLSGPVGLRTRTTLITGFLVPWLGGLVLYRGVGVPDRAIPVEAVIVAVIVFSMAIVAVGSGMFHEKVDRSRRQLSRRLATLATVDHLTGMLNRTGATSELMSRWSGYVENRIGQCLILMDLDNFKQINDRFGHDQGDRVLSAIGRMIRPHLRSGDAVGRWGGEEFVIMIEGVSECDAVTLAERLRQAVEGLPTVLAGADHSGKTLPYDVTGSFGVTSFHPGDTNHEQAIKRADVALYAAKANGRNQVAVQTQGIHRVA